MLQWVNFVDLMQHLWQYVVMQFGKQTTIYTTCHGAGCSRKVPGGVWYCGACKKDGGAASQNIRRSPEKPGGVLDTEATRLRSTRAWTRFAKYTLQSNPWCLDPFREHTTPTPARHVHHIEPVATAPDLLLEPSNVVPLCISCHARIESLHRNGHNTKKYFDSLSVNHT